MPTDPEEQFKDVPGLVGLIIRGEISKKCDTCDQEGIFSSLLPINDPLKIAVVREVLKRMGCPDWQPDPGRKISSIFHCRECVVKYKKELAKLYSEIVICDLCGLRDGSRFYEFSWLAPEGFVPETLMETFKRLDKEQHPPAHPNPATTVTGVPMLVFCPQCKEKFFEIHAAIVKEQSHA